MAYLDAAAFKLLTIAPAAYVDEIEAREPGWLAARLEAVSGWLDARLRKRYAAPFAVPYPGAVTGWLCDLVTWDLYLKRGVDPTDREVAEVLRRAEAARAEVKEAADSKEGLFDLPLVGSAGTGISKGSVLGYSEASPYTWSKNQAADAEFDELR